MENEKPIHSLEWVQKQKDWDILEAKSEILKLKIILLYLNDNDSAVMVKTAGIEVGLCINKNLIPVIELEIKEIEKFLNDEENEWE